VRGLVHISFLSHKKHYSSASTNYNNNIGESEGNQKVNQAPTATKAT